MPPQTPKDSAAPQAPHPDITHKPVAFESDLERHRASVDEVYGSHGVQPEPEETLPQEGTGRGSRGLSRVGERRRR